MGDVYANVGRKQMVKVNLMTKEALPDFEDIVAIVPTQEPILRAVRILVHSLHPSVVEISRPGDRAVSWGWGPKKMSEGYVCALPYKDYVNLAFYRGVMLPDPSLLLKGTGKAMRHISLKLATDIDNPALVALLIAARQERQLALGI